jgi:hypothetical protein
MHVGEDQRVMSQRVMDHWIHGSLVVPQYYGSMKIAPKLVRERRIGNLILDYLC